MEFIEYSKNLHEKVVQQYNIQDLTFTDSPCDYVVSPEVGETLFPILIFEQDDLVGFFCLDKGESLAAYGEEVDDTILLRGYSIDTRYRQKGYGVFSMQHIFELLEKTTFCDVQHIVLAVNEQNIPA